MNTHRHTPGPWTEEREEHIQCIAGNRDTLCVEIQRDGFTIGYWVPTEWDGRCPDSQLISAAPELLDALRRLTNWAREHTSPIDPNSPHEILLDACAALTKAHGSDAWAT